MVIGTHNSWSYLPVKKWWMKLLRFTAKCQDLNIQEQYDLGVRCFDLRISFTPNFIVSHGIIQYKISVEELLEQLKWLNSKKDCYVRVIHEVRNKSKYTSLSIEMFKMFCKNLEVLFPFIKFWCGRNLYNWKIDYKFPFEPSCDEKYASVCFPKIIDDWFPRLFAKRYTKGIIENGTDKDILLIDFVNYGY